MPEVFNVHLYEKATESGVVYGSKAVGEPPLMHAFSVREALRQAAGAFGPAGHSVDLGSPATPEAVFWAIEAAAGGRCRAGCDRSRPHRWLGSDLDWLEALQQLRREGAPGVLVTVVEVRGHAPRDPGAKMLVGTDQSWGSVGGGNLEETAVRRAREMIASGAAGAEVLESRLNEHARNDHGRQCCGGEVRLLLEPFLARPTVAVFGVGHVGYELARILSRLEIRLHLVDSRAEQARSAAAGRDHRRTGRCRRASRRAGRDGAGTAARPART